MDKISTIAKRRKTNNNLGNPTRVLKDSNISSVSQEKKIKKKFPVRKQFDIKFQNAKTVGRENINRTTHVTTHNQLTGKFRKSSEEYKRKEINQHNDHTMRSSKREIHPLLSRKRPLSRIVASPSYNVFKTQVPVKKDRRQTFTVNKSQTNRRHTITVPRNIEERRQTMVVKKDQGERRKTMVEATMNYNLLAKNKFQTNEKSQVKITTPGAEKTPWKNAELRRRERLDLWLEAKGKTPGVTPRPKKRECFGIKSPHPNKKSIVKDFKLSMCQDLPPAIESFLANDCDELSDHIVLDEKLQEIMKKLQQGIDSEDIQMSLDSILHNHPSIVRYADYWICRARLAARENDVQRVVCLLEQAYTFDAKPAEKIKEEICSFLESIEASGETQDHDENTKDFLLKYAITPGRRVHFATGTLSPLQFKSSIIRFCIVESKVFKKRLNAQIKRKIMTPVRRSTRLRRSDLPNYLQADNRIVESPSEVENEILDGEITFRPNKTINTPLNNGWLIHDRSVDEKESLDEKEELELSFM